MTKTETWTETGLLPYSRETIGLSSTMKAKKLFSVLIRLYLLFSRLDFEGVTMMDYITAFSCGVFTKKICTMTPIVIKRKLFCEGNVRVDIIA